MKCYDHFGSKFDESKLPALCENKYFSQEYIDIDEDHKTPS